MTHVLFALLGGYIDVNLLQRFILILESKNDQIDINLIVQIQKYFLILKI
jgi:hypothetical protein